MSRWTPSLHPRDANGRFRSKTTASVRLSTRSVSATVGRRFALVPGKVNLYVGGLVRLENASRNKGPIDKLQDKIQDRLVNAVPDGKLRAIASGLAGSGQFREGSTLITGSTGRKGTPTIRVGTSGGNLKPGGGVQTGNRTRSPNRKPRAPRTPRARRVA